jgi:uncharacterized protein YjbI with pentapeptide repeats
MQAVATCYGPDFREFLKEKRLSGILIHRGFIIGCYVAGKIVRDEERRVDQQQPSRRPATRRLLLWAGGIAALAVLIIVICGYLFGLTWTGLPKRTLWDWLELLIVPGVLALGGYLFTRSENKRRDADAARQKENDQALADERAEHERALAEQRRLDETVRDYINDVGDLLLEKGLGKAEAGEAVSILARARTLTVLRMLNGDRKHHPENQSLAEFLRSESLNDRKRRVVEFLYEAKLIDRRDEVGRSSSSLEEAALFKADLALTGIFLDQVSTVESPSISLEGADLHRANLKLLHLNKVNLEGADLRYADLSFAELQGAWLRGTDMRGAALRDADLSMSSRVSPSPTYDVPYTVTNLSHARLTGADLKEARLEGADLRYAEFQAGVLDYPHAKKEDTDRVNQGVKDLRRLTEGIEDLDMSSPSGKQRMKDLGELLKDMVEWRKRFDKTQRERLSDEQLPTANLKQADLTGANLSFANLTGTNLTTTNLTGVKLPYATLTDASITDEQLAQCRVLKGATMPDGKVLKSDVNNPDGPTFEEWLKSKSRGEDGENSGFS